MSSLEPNNKPLARSEDALRHPVDDRLKSTPNEEVKLPDGRTVWLSRSCAALGVLTAYDKETNAYYVAVGRRGPAVPDYKGHIAICGGYLDHDESWQGAAIREIWEEVGLNLYEFADRGEVYLPEEPFRITSDPGNDSRQNVTARFHFKLSCEELPPLSIENSEPAEVSEAFWFKLDPDSISKANFAFNHAQILLEMNQEHGWWGA